MPCNLIIMFTPLTGLKEALLLRSQTVWRSFLIYVFLGQIVVLRLMNVREEVCGAGLPG
jgi:hypothetical protein